MQVTDMGMLYTGNYFFAEIGINWGVKAQLHFQFASHIVFTLLSSLLPSSLAVHLWMFSKAIQIKHAM